MLKNTLRYRNGRFIGNIPSIQELTTNPDCYPYYIRLKTHDVEYVMKEYKIKKIFDDDCCTTIVKFDHNYKEDKVKFKNNTYIYKVKATAELKRDGNVTYVQECKFKIELVFNKDGTLRDIKSDDAVEMEIRFTTTDIYNRNSAFHSTSPTL